MTDTVATIGRRKCGGEDNVSWAEPDVDIIAMFVGRRTARASRLGAGRRERTRATGRLVTVASIAVVTL